jgi:hypothetical protein
MDVTPASIFAPYRLPPGSLADEATRRAAAAAAEPLMVPLDEPLPSGVAAQAMAIIPAGSAGAPDEACRSADGSPSGFDGDLRACLVSERQRTRIERAVTLALELGFKGACLDRPDAPLSLGILGAGFCPDCQRAFSRELAREYGDHFQPIDYLALAREALAQASGALGHEQLPFGRDFWRMRAATLDAAVRAQARAARDASRAHGKPFEVAALFEAIGPAQLHAARHLDAAIFPAQAQQLTTGAGLFRLLRAAMGRRPGAALVSGATAPQLARIAAVAAACGIEVVAEGADPAATLAPVRRFARAVAEQKHAPAAASPVVECAILYSGDCDLWTGGRHREQVERAGEALAALHVQAPVVLRAEDAPPQAALVLAGAGKLSAQEARAVLRRLEAGGGVLAFGAVGAVDEAGRKAPSPLPAGKPGGAKVEKGIFAEVGELPAPRPGQLLDEKPLVAVLRALSAVVGKGRRATSVAGRAPLLTIAVRNEERLDVHLVTLAGRAQGSTLFVGLQLAGGARRARFQSAAGHDERIGMNPSGYSLSTVLPAFEGYAVLTLPG